MDEDKARRRAWTFILTAVASLLTAAATWATSPSEGKVQTGYETLAETSGRQAERIRRLEALVTVLLLDSGRTSADVRSAFGEDDPVLRVVSLLRPRPVPGAADAALVLPAPEAPPALPQERVRTLVHDLAKAQEAPEAPLPAYGEL